jgi:hypothetical protein
VRLAIWSPSAAGALRRRLPALAAEMDVVWGSEDEAPPEADLSLYDVADAP